MVYQALTRIINKIKRFSNSFYSVSINQEIEKDTNFDKNDLYKLICVVLYKNKDDEKLNIIKNQFVEKIVKRNTVFLSKNNVNLSQINYNEKINAQLIYYINQLEDIIKSEELIKKERKSGNIYATEFCKAIINTKKVIQLSNIKFTPSLKNLADSMTDKTDRLLKINTIINQKMAYFFDKDKQICYIELKKMMVLDDVEEEIFSRYIDYFIAEIKFNLNNKKAILHYFNNKKNNNFLVSFTKLIMFYFFMEITDNSQQNKELNNKILEFILILIEENNFDKNSLFNLFKSIEYINFSNKEYNSVYCLEHFWIKKDKLINQVFGKQFFEKLSKQDIISFIKNYYAEYRKMPNQNAKLGLQQSFVNMIEKFDKKIMLEIAKDYKE